MPDPTGEARPINYSQEDRNARLLWKTQIPKANPWEHRQPQDQEDEAPPSKEAPAPAAEPEVRRKTISQTDKLSLHREEALENPFERLLEHRLHIELSSHDSPEK